MQTSVRRIASIARAFPTKTRDFSSSGASNPLLLYTSATPNGQKVSVLLEELKAAYAGFDYDVHKINLSQNTQKEPWYIKINPNGRIPVLVDRARNDFTVFETGAILLYLEQHYDKKFHFSFDPVKQPNDYSEMLQWIFWAHGGLGPMQGQAVHFGRAPVDIPYAKTRYIEEVKRLYGVLEIRLSSRDYLAGPDKGTFTIADINAQTWVARHRIAGIEDLDAWPGLKAWFERISNREGVMAGLLVPS